MITSFAFLASQLGAGQNAPSIDDYVQKGFRDVAFTWRVVRKDEAAMAKINKDFGQAYRFEKTTVRLKDPYKLRIDSDVEDTKLSYVVNGTVQAYKIPKLRINAKTDLADKPGRRQTSMDFGILTPSMFVDLFDAKFVQRDVASDQVVFDLTYKPRFGDATRYRVWLDPKTRTVRKREWYHREGRLLATFLYDAPIEGGGAAVPTRLSIRNAEGALAAETRLENATFNAGIPDEAFAI